MGQIVQGPGACRCCDPALPRAQERPLWALAAALVVILLAVVWFRFQHSADRILAGRQGAMHHVLQNLAQAAKMYEFEHDAYPPGDGTRSAALVRALSSHGDRKLPFFEFRTDMLDERGEIRSILRSREIVHYRCPGVHNPTGFDLWCRDASGREDGINNWE